eukprot:TRINITY_DN6575_c0_g1_i8.p1 TRINITY_DN6575_c0_g1~~TRINITY_DN6575_c0_g1_i8.p1  ORF type:complete len:1125 (+),score=97.45 TRINITY_DN6575_c0_g1_i8:93-3467(+)
MDNLGIQSTLIIQNTLQQNISSWRLAFAFTENETLSQLIDDDVTRLSSGSRNILQWQPSDENDILAAGTQSSYDLILEKNTTLYGETVGPITNVSFNNLQCLQEDRDIEEVFQIDYVDPGNESIQVNFSYISYNESVAEADLSLISIHLISKMQNAVKLENLTVYYYFQGGNNSGVSVDDFEANCFEAEPFGCSGINLYIEKGITQDKSARLRLVIKFTPEAGYLLGEEYVAQSLLTYIVEDTGEQAFSSVRLNLQISAKRNNINMNILDDYSFKESQSFFIRSNNDTDADMFNYEEVVNDHIVVYNQDTLVSGIGPWYYLRQQYIESIQSAQGRPCFPSTQGDIMFCKVDTSYCCAGSSPLILDIFEHPSSPPPIPLPEPSNNDDNVILLAVILTIVGCVLVVVTGYFGRRIYKKFYIAHGNNNSPGGFAGESQLQLNSAFANGGVDVYGNREQSVTIGMSGGQAGDLGYFSQMMGFSAKTTNVATGLMQQYSSHIQHSGEVREDQPLLLMTERCKTMSSLPNKVQLSIDSKQADDGFEPADSVVDIHSGKTWNEIFESDGDLSDIPKKMQELIDAGWTEDSLLPPVNLPPPVMWQSPRSEIVDLNVDFQNEVVPHLGRVLGEGGFGKVYEGQWRGQKVAVKVFNDSRLKEGSQAYKVMQDEVEMCCKISGQCDGVVKILGASLQDPVNKCIIMELVEGGSLSDRIYHKAKRRLSYLEVLQIAHDISSALAFLHPVIIHRDLKPQNILLDNEGRAKIADFGISKFKDPDASYLSVTLPTGTPAYMAPELFNGTKVSERCDVYSLGVIIWECLARKKPWAELENFAQIIMSVGIMGERLKIPSDTPTSLKRLLERCWDTDPYRRPSTHEIMRQTEIAIQQELQTLRAKSPIVRNLSIRQAQSPTTSSTSRVWNRQDSWSSRLTLMKYDVNTACSKLEKTLGRPVSRQEPQVGDLEFVEQNVTTSGNISRYISLPPDFDASSKERADQPSSSADKQQSPFGKIRHKSADEDIREESYQNPLFGILRRLSTVYSRSSDDLSWEPGQGQSIRNRQNSSPKQPPKAKEHTSTQGDRNKKEKKRRKSDQIDETKQSTSKDDEDPVVQSLTVYLSAQDSPQLSQELKDVP